MSEAGQAPCIQTDARSRARVFPPKLRLVTEGVLCGPVSHPGHWEQRVTWDKVSSFILSHIKIEEELGGFGGNDKFSSLRSNCLGV